MLTSLGTSLLAPTSYKTLSQGEFEASSPNHPALSGLEVNGPKLELVNKEPSACDYIRVTSWVVFWGSRTRHKVLRLAEQITEQSPQTHR